LFVGLAWVLRRVAVSCACCVCCVWVFGCGAPSRRGVTFFSGKKESYPPPGRRSPLKPQKKLPKAKAKAKAKEQKQKKENAAIEAKELAVTCILPLEQGLSDAFGQSPA